MGLYSAIHNNIVDNQTGGPGQEEIMTTKFDDVYERSMQDPEGFWAEAAPRL